MQNSSSTQQFDGQIYFESSDIPSPDALPDDVITESGETHSIDIDDSAKRLASGPVFERTLARWKDPLTPPKTRTKCVKMCRVGPVKTCCGWKLQTQWLYRTAKLQVWTRQPGEIPTMIEECMRVAAVAAAIAAIITGGSAAIAVAERAFFTCLAAKLGDDLISVRIDMSSSWSDWS